MTECWDPLMIRGTGIATNDATLLSALVSALMRGQIVLHSTTDGPCFFFFLSLTLTRSLSERLAFYCFDVVYFNGQKEA